MNLLYVLLVVGLVCVLFVARSVWPAKNHSGHGIVSCNVKDLSSLASERLRVATFNIQSGKSLAGVRDIQSSANLLANADIAGVQEVLGEGWLNKIGLGRSQSVALCSAGNFDYLFSPTRYRWFREQRGNTILSKLKLLDWDMKMLPSKDPKSPRNMTIAHFQWAGETAVFINTHLHTKEGREDQLREVLAEFDQHPRAILMGDFNTKADDPTLNAWLANTDALDAIKVAGLVEHEQSQKANRIDWIFTRGFTIHGGVFEEKGISDHPMYQVELSH